MHDSSVAYWSDKVHPIGPLYQATVCMHNSPIVLLMAVGAFIFI